jgi:hypothetical protein
MSHNTAGEEYTGDLPNIEMGDVRIVCPVPEALIGSLSIASVVRFSGLEQEIPEIRPFYQSELMAKNQRPEAVVPDLRTVRPCTPEEWSHLVVEGDHRAYIEDPRNVVVIPAGYDGPDGEWALLRRDPVSGEHPIKDHSQTLSPPHMLTISRDRDDLVLAGLHPDKGSRDKSRIGLSDGPAVKGLWVGVHSAAQLSRMYDTEVTFAEDVRRLNPSQIGHVVCITLPRGYIYLAHTRKLIHDATTVLSHAPHAVAEARLGFQRYRGYEARKLDVTKAAPADQTSLGTFFGTEQ